MRLKIILIVLLIISQNNTVNSQETIIHNGESWKYYDGDSIPEYYWFINNFPDDDWKEGLAQFGYGEGDEATLLDYGSNPNLKKITHYFRKSFYIDDPDKFHVYLIKLLRDDGAIVYINGREVWRSNMPDGIITDSTVALISISDLQEDVIKEYVISPDYFIKGVNTICVSLHQSRPSTSDCSFDLELIRNNDLFSANQLLINQQRIDQILNKGFSFLSIQLELANKNNEINHLELRNEYLRNLGLFIIIFFFVLLMLAFYLIIRNIRMTHQWGNNLREIKNELLQKNKEIINYALNMVQQKQFLKVIKEQLDNTNKTNGNLPEIDRIISKISYHDDYDDEWERLKVHFDTVHSGFFSRLKTQFPELTQSELQHCSYIKLQLQTKEIARMLNIDPKSVQASRYRIKKKMSLTIESDLREIIETF